jgi:hypothetical protein
VLSAADRFAIEDLFAVYHWAMDTGDVDGFADTFTDDGLVLLDITRRHTRHQGRCELIGLAESLRAWNPFPGCQHHAGQLLIDAQGGRHCRVRSFCFVAECRGEPPYTLRLAGRSDDLLVRHGDGWRFEQRHVRLWHGDARVNHALPG